MITPADSAPQPPGQMPASGFDIQAPYAAGDPQAIRYPGDPDPGGRDDVAGTAAGAQAAAEARWHEHQGDTYGQGSQIGDGMDLPPQDFSVPTAHATGYGGQE